MRYAKFIIISLLILAAAYLGISGHPENTDAAETSLISYTYHEDGHAEVVSCDRNATGVLEIPSSVTVNGVTYSVTKILNNTFYCCTGLTSIEIPASVTVIEANEFDGTCSEPPS